MIGGRCSELGAYWRPWRHGGWRNSDSRLVSLFVFLDVSFRRQQQPERVCVFPIPWMIIISANRVMTRRFGRVFARTSGGPRTARRLPGLIFAECGLGGRGSGGGAKKSQPCVGLVSPSPCHPLALCLPWRHGWLPRQQPAHGVRQASEILSVWCRSDDGRRA